MTSVAGYIAQASNKAADVADVVVSGKVVIPTALGAMGGWLAGVGPQMGAFHGLAAGALHAWIVKPADQYVTSHQGTGKDQFHANTVTWIRTAGTIAEFVLPILLTAYFGEAALKAAGSKLPQFAGWIVVPATVIASKYNWWRGILASILPMPVQYGIEWMRSEDPRGRTRV